MWSSKEFIITDGVLQSYEGDSAEIVIPEGVHTISKLAFSKEKREYIKIVKLPESLEIIEDDAFNHFDSLEQIIIPPNVKAIGKWAFYNCQALHDVTIKGTPSLGIRAFQRTLWEKNESAKPGIQIKSSKLLKVDPDITEFIIPYFIREIGDSAFSNSNIKELIVPHSVIEIGNSAFEGSKIEHIVLPESLEIIRSNAFSNCANLKELTIPKSVTNLDFYAFKGLFDCVLTILNECDDENKFTIHTYPFREFHSCIKEVRVPYGSVAMRVARKYGLKVTTLPGNPQKYHYINDEFCCDENILVDYFGSNEIINIPDGIEAINGHAFSNLNIKKVNIPKSVHTICAQSFSDCGNLIEVSGDGVKTICASAFSNCINLHKVVFPELEECHETAFEDCPALKEENKIIPNDVVIIEKPKLGSGVISAVPVPILFRQFGFMNKDKT